MAGLRAAPEGPESPVILTLNRSQNRHKMPIWDAYLSLAVEAPTLCWMILALTVGTLAILLGPVMPWLPADIQS